MYGIPRGRDGHPVLIEDDFALYTELNNIPGTGGGRRFPTRREARGHLYRSIHNSLPSTLCINCYMDHGHYECEYPRLNHRPHLLANHPLCLRCLSIHPPTHYCQVQAVPVDHTSLQVTTAAPAPHPPAPHSHQVGPRHDRRGDATEGSYPPSLPPSPPASPPPSLGRSPSEHP